MTVERRLRMAKKGWLFLLGVLIPLIFNTGCAGALKGYARDVLDEGKTWFHEDLVPGLKEEMGGLADAAKDAAIDAGKGLINDGIEQAKEYVDKKLAEKEKAELAKIDEQLAKIAEPDPDTGVMMAKTWRDFDSDRDDHLSPGELAALNLYVGKKAWGRDDMATILKAVGGSSLVLGGIYGAGKLRKKKPIQNTEAAPSPPAAPPPPATAPVAASPTGGGGGTPAG
jgi:hypothetical protein